MINHREHFSINFFEDESHTTRYFLKIFKSKAKDESRPDVLSPDELKKNVTAIGKGKKINITRLAYDGTPEDPPIAFKIVDIREEYFTGTVVNVERSIKQSENDTLVYVKGGGGTIDFYYKDGDIINLKEDIDEEIVEEQRNIEEIKEILDALDLNEEIHISYYDKAKGGVINGVGKLINKDLESLNFKVLLRITNKIQLSQPQEIELNLSRDKIIDLEVVI